MSATLADARDLVLRTSARDALARSVYNSGQDARLGGCPMLGRSIVVVAFVSLLGACQSTVVPSPPSMFPSPASTASESAQARPQASAAPTMSTTAPASSGVASTIELPHPGG